MPSIKHASELAHAGLDETCLKEYERGRASGYSDGVYAAFDRAISIAKLAEAKRESPAEALQHALKLWQELRGRRDAPSDLGDIA